MNKNYIFLGLVVLVVGVVSVALTSKTGGSLGGLTITNTQTHTSDLNIIGAGTSTVRTRSTTSNRGGCLEINATSTATTARLVLSPAGATSTFNGTVYFQYGTCE